MVGAFAAMAAKLLKNQFFRRIDFVARRQIISVFALTAHKTYGYPVFSFCHTRYYSKDKEDPQTLQNGPKWHILVIENLHNSFMKRKSVIERNTNETKIAASLTVDGTGKRKIDTPIGFLNHMLDLFAKHGLFDLSVKARGDTHIDEHHTVEDIGIVLGSAFAKALGDKTGIRRYGFFILPMDETLATVAVDFAGRYSFQFNCPFTREKVGDLSTELVSHFWDAFAQHAKINLHIKVENGGNEHHKIEGIFKATARAIRMACEIDPRAKKGIPSTKGKL